MKLGRRNHFGVATPSIAGSLSVTLELVSGAMPQRRHEFGCRRIGTKCEAWMLKQVRHDGVARNAPKHYNDLIM